MKFVVCVGVVSVSLAVIGTAAASAPPTILKGPYLQNVTPSGIRVRWETDTGLDSRVDYGPTASYGSFVAGNYSTQLSGGTYLHDVPLTGLTADTNYHYMVTTGATSSADHLFPTAIAPDTSFFRFSFYGDSQAGDTLTPDTTVQQAIADGVLNSNPMFVIHTGDVVYRGDVYAQWGSQFFAPSASMLFSVPFFFAVGNHELGDPFLAATFFYWPLAPGTWFSFDYGNAHFIILDTDAAFSPGTPQYEWLVSDLAGASKTWLFVAFHHPPYTSSLSEFHPVMTAVQQILVPLFEAYRVDMVLNSHVHWYERSEKNGIYYITSGGGGAQLATEQETINPYQQAWASTYHFCTVDVSADQLLFKARYANGTPFDSVYVGNVPLLRLNVVPDITSPGNHVIVNAHADPIPYNYDAWAVVILPNGQMETMVPGKGLRPGVFPIVKNAPGIASPLDVTLLSTTVAPGVRTGTYTAAVGLFPHDTAPINQTLAPLKAFPGCFQQVPLTINQ